MDSNSVTGRRYKLRANSCGHYHTALTRESRSMGRGNLLLRIHRFSGRVQPATEPVSAAFNATCMCEGISPRKPGEAGCRENKLSSRLLRRSLFLTTPFHRTPRKSNPVADSSIKGSAWSGLAWNLKSKHPVRIHTGRCSNSIVVLCYFYA